ncbi:MAG: adenylate/guanylate cyclase domain-containing protein, partial [Hyphomicrobiaceae bacterium]
MSVPKLSRSLVYWVVTLGLLAVMLAVRVVDPEPIARFRSSVFDAYLVLRPRAVDPRFPVKIVDIDEASLAAVGQWPWPRTRLAEIVTKLKEAGAKSITFDLVMPESDRMSPDALVRVLGAQVPGLEPALRGLGGVPTNDFVLGEAVTAAPVVLGFVGIGELGAQPGPARASFVTAGDDPRQFVPVFAGSLNSLPVITAGAKGLGAVNWMPSQDQIVRRVGMLVSVGGVLYPSLALETLRVSLGETTVFVRASGGSGTEAFGQKTGIATLRVGKTVIPTDGDGQLWLRFSRADPGRTISARRILDGTFEPKDVAGRMILIGSSSPLLFDLRATPLATTVPGVEIHAQALEQMVSGDHIVRPDYAAGAELLFLAFSGGLVAWLIAKAGARTAAVVGLVSVACVAGVSWLLYARAGYLFDPVYPSLALAAVYLVGTLHNTLGTERERTQIRSTFSHYMAPELVAELARDPSRLKLGGEMRVVTVLFADVRGFTRISEEMEAEPLVALLNQLFTPVTDIIVDHRGTIDKFMGDAVMAFWNAPLDDGAHAQNACRAALAMIAELERLNAAWQMEAIATGKPHPRIELGIGLNTGLCCVGNLGSPRRFDYSIIGEAVNVAARLEGVTAEYGMPVIVGEGTAEAISGFAVLEIDRIVLRGKQRPERIYAVLGDEGMAGTAEFREVRARHAQVMAALEAGDMAA